MEPSEKRSRLNEETALDSEHVFATAGRNVPVRLGQTAVVIIDCQELFWDHASDYAAARMRKSVLPNTQALLQAARTARLEIIYVVIEALTKDARDNSLDYKISKIVVPRGSPKAQVLPEIAPAEDDIVISKTSCSVFCSTNINYVLRNLNIRHVVFTGVITNQCVESAVRDACDLGYLCTVTEDCCAALSEREHQSALHNMRGFARINTSTEMVRELEQLVSSSS